MKAAGFTAVLLLLAMACSVQAADNNMKAFPPAAAGMVRYVLQLPPPGDEAAFKVQLIVGKMVLLDARNHYFFSGKIDEEIIEGWGFPRYLVTSLGQMAGTQMAVYPDEPKVNRFITLGGDPYLIRYNSRLPIVIYAPEGVEVRYRIWSAGAEAKAVDKG